MVESGNAGRGRSLEMGLITEPMGSESCGYLYNLPLQLPRCGINFLDLAVPAVSMLVNSDECILAAAVGRLQCTQVAGVQELAADETASCRT